jgi:hypothetical protein
MLAPTLTSIHALTLDIGGIPILVRTDSADFAHMLEDRYGEFVTAGTPQALVELDIELVKEPGLGVRDTGHGARDTGLGSRDSGFGLRTSSPQSPAHDLDEYDQDLSVRLEQGRWVMERGDFRAEWDPQGQRGWVRQTANPYAIDGVLRILHSLILAREGGFLVHAASAVRNGRAFVFAGVSGAGKTTLARLAPPDVTLLTDEISYVRDTGDGTRDTRHGTRETGDVAGIMGKASGDKGERGESQIADSEAHAPCPVSRVPYPMPRVPCPVPRVPAFKAFGTPFAGELARIGQNVRAPLAGLFLLKQGAENRIEPLSEGQAVRELLRHVLFFARDEELVGMVFQTVCDFVKRVPVRRLVFTKDASVWELIGIDD